MLTDAVYLQGIVNRTKGPSELLIFHRWNRRVVIIHGLKIKKKKLLEVTFQSKSPLLLRRFSFLAVWDAFIPKGFHMFLILFSRCFHTATDHAFRKIFVRLHSKLLVHTRPFSKICWMESFLGETTQDDLEKIVLTLDVYRLWMYLNRCSWKSELIWCWYHGFVADGMADILSQATWTIFTTFPVKLSRQLSDVLTQLVKLLGITLLKTNMAPGKWTL